MAEQAERKLHPAIRVSVEAARGCGFRKLGGMYVVSDGAVQGCGKLPCPLDALNRCPHCGERLPEGFGVKPSRQPSMIPHPELLWRDIPCSAAGDGGMCRTCPLSNAYETGPALMIWVGGSYYPTPEAFMQEAQAMGLSRRIPQVPKDFEVGETWVLLAHRKAIRKVEMVDTEPDGQLRIEPREVESFEPGVFGVFRPTRIEVIVSGDESGEEIEALVKRGLTPVLVERVGEGAAEREEGVDDAD